MNCSNCGSSLTGSESVCPYCGKPTVFNINTQIKDTNNEGNIGNGGIPTSQPVVQTQNQKIEQESSQANQTPLNQNGINNKKSNSKNTLLIIAIVVIIALLLMCFYLLLNRNNNIASVNNNANNQTENNPTGNNTEQNKDNDDDTETDNSTKTTCTRQNNVLDAKYELDFVNNELKNFSFIYTLKNIDESLMTEAETQDFLVYAFMYLDLTKYKDDDGVIFSADVSDSQIKVDFKVEVGKAGEVLKSDLLAKYENKSIEDIKTQITNDGFMCE